MRRLFEGLALLGVVAGVGVGAFVLGDHSNSAQADTSKPALISKGFAPATASGNFYDAKRLQESILTTYNSTPPLEHRAVSATCINVGRKATCLLRTDTVNIAANVTLSADGRTYVAQAQP